MTGLLALYRLQEGPGGDPTSGPSVRLYDEPRVRISTVDRMSKRAGLVRRISRGIDPGRDIMKVMVMVKATTLSETGAPPSEATLSAMERFNGELVKAGVLLAAEGLQASSNGKRVHYRGGERHVVDGPFAETKELVAGFWLWQVTSIEEAIEGVKRCPNPMPGDSEIEIRQIFEPEDFGDAFTPELREQEARLRSQSAAKQ